VIIYHAKNKRELERVGFLLVDLNIRNWINHDKPLDIEIDGTPINTLCANAAHLLEVCETLVLDADKDYARIGKDRSCNPEYLRMADRASLILRARVIIACME